jgi:creatinine amidohydrolase
VRIRDCNWVQIEEYLQRDDRVVLPIGSTEQHAYLSLETDNILAERAAVEAAEPLGVPVLPVLPYGLTPAFAAFPGSPSLRVETLVAVLRDVLDSLYGQGFRRFLLVNGHGGNVPAASLVREWAADVTKPEAQAIFHSWWENEEFDALTQSIDPETRYGTWHAAWLENFPWTRLDGVDVPAERKPLLDSGAYRVADPEGVRSLLGDGSFGGPYQRPDEEMLHVWEIVVTGVRELLENGWR